jgi:alpha-galactosidase
MPDATTADLAITYACNRTLEPGQSLDTLKTFVSVHSGDCFATLANYRKMMIAQGVRFPQAPPEAFEPIWCAWGYRRTFTPDQIYGAMPIVNKLRFGWVTLDDGWQTAEGDWHLDKTKFPAGDADMKAMVDRIHAGGFKAQLWWAPMSVDPDTDLIREHPGQLLLNKDGSRQKITYWNAFYLCPALPEVRRDAAAFVTKALKVWGFDGLKLDGQYMNAAPPCYNPAHKHAAPNESVEGVPGFFKAIFDAATAAKPNAVVEYCPCGTSFSFFNLPYMNMSVASDPRRSWQVRTKGKSLKALTGDSVAYFGDHVELSDEGRDFASTVALGGVIGTEFTWPVGSGPVGRSGKRTSDLTPDREAHWSKWLGIYKQKMLSRGEYLGSLYDIGFDRPEAHAIQKDGKLYYGFFAADFKGKVELRGLQARKYKLVDYENARDLGTVQGPVAAVDVAFTHHLMLEATPQ